MSVAAGEVVTLHPGDVALGVRGDRLETLLGSCVAVVLVDPRRTVGAMCHIVHSRPGLRTEARSAAHADVALESMIDLLQARGITARLCEAYVYGGGDMFPRMRPRIRVGDDNVSWVLEALRALRIRVLAVDVGGPVYRQLRWCVGPEAPRVVAVPI